MQNGRRDPGLARRRDPGLAKEILRGQGDLFFVMLDYVKTIHPDPFRLVAVEAESVDDPSG